MDSRTFEAIAELLAELLGYCIFSTAAILAHEIGHVVAGALCGFRLLSVRIGPVRFHLPLSSSWEFRLTGLLTGEAVMQFRELPGTDATLRAIGFIAGGPAMNVLMALALLPLAIHGSAFGNFCGVYLVISLFIAFVSMVPYRVGMRTSDGNKLLALIFNRAKRDEILFSLSLSARLKEIVALCRARQFAEGLKKTDDVLQCIGLSRSFSAGPELQQRLRKLKSSLEKELTTSDISSTVGAQ